MAIAITVVMMAASAAVTYAAVHPSLENPNISEVPFEARYVVELRVAVSGDFPIYAVFSNEPASIARLDSWGGNAVAYSFPAGTQFTTVADWNNGDEFGFPFAMIGIWSTREEFDEMGGNERFFNQNAIELSSDLANIDLFPLIWWGEQFELRDEPGAMFYLRVATDQTPQPTPEPTEPITLPALITAPNLSTASTWAHEGINSAFAYGLIPQNLQAQYTQATTRAEFAAFAVSLYEAVTGREITELAQFNDTTDINVQKMGGLGVVSGVGGGNFAPNDTLTREQAAVMLARLAYVIGQPLPQSAPAFADNGSISSWAIDGAGQVQATGIMGGVGNNNFDPSGEYTREQSIITMLRLFEILN